LGFGELRVPMLDLRRWLGRLNQPTLVTETGTVIEQSAAGRAKLGQVAQSSSRRAKTIMLLFLPLRLCALDRYHKIRIRFVCVH